MTIGIARVLMAGAGVWLLSTILALASCGGFLGDGFIDEEGRGSPSGGLSALSAPGSSVRSLLRTAGNAIAELEHAGGDGALAALLQDASAIVALSDVGILKSAQGSSVSATVALARALLNGGKATSAMPSMSPTDVVEEEAKKKRLKRRRRPAEETDSLAKSQVLPKDLLYTHQQCYIGTDEAEVREGWG